jgi:tRNA-modifying protein YgfZ
MAALAFPSIDVFDEMNLTSATSGYRALRENAAWIDASSRGKIVLRGEDRARLLHALCTNQIQDLKPGDGCYALFLNAQGRILADVNVLCFEDHLLLDTEPELRPALYEHLDRYIIADDVTLEDVTETRATILLEGPIAGGCLGVIGAPQPTRLWSHELWTSVGVTVQRTPSGYAIYAPTSSVRRLTERLGVAEASEADARTVRIEQGRPRYGEEITDRYLVQEAGLLQAVSFSKGCYLGQEIVERVRSRGQVHKQLCALEIDTARFIDPGTKVTCEGADAGEIASAAFSPALDRTVALAYLRAPLPAVGATLRVDSSPAVRVERSAS